VLKGWREIAANRYAWKLILKEARVLHGPYSQWKERITIDACNICLTYINIRHF
jgi:hypothetical protein